LGFPSKSFGAYERAITIQPGTVTAWQGVVELYKTSTEWEILKKYLLEIIPKFISYDLYIIWFSNILFIRQGNAKYEEYCLLLGKALVNLGEYQEVISC
jgi:hypothetical protein